MSMPDPVAKLEEVLLARGMQQKDIPDFVARYAKRPALDAARELQQRGIHYQIAFLAIAKIQEPEITRESSLEEPLDSSAGKWALLALGSFCAGLWFFKHGALNASLGPWVLVGISVFGLFSALRAVSKWIG
jgi:hypothetical protein